LKSHTRGERGQVQGLRERGVRGVAALHSQVPEAEQREVLTALRTGRLHLLYVMPERCAREDFLAVTRQSRIDLLAVDEAHCISEWGHDFRPANQLLDDAVRARGRPPILALTATATPWVRDQIVERL
jgi:ATP-dependent DNA helicase RecQ